MVPDRVVFDAEPLIAHADDEPGGETVSEYLEAVRIENVSGYASCVNLAEVRYVLARKYDRTVVDEYLRWLFDLGLETVDVGPTWVPASEYVLAYNPAMGDAFALATAEHVDATLLVGGDREYEEIDAVPIERFRDRAA